MDMTKGQEAPTALQMALQQHLAQIWSMPSVREHPFFVEWANKVDRPGTGSTPLTVERLCEVCCREGSAVKWLDKLKPIIKALHWNDPKTLAREGRREVIEAAQWMTLVLCERRIARDGALRQEEATDSPLIGLSAPAAAALVAAQWLGLTVTLKLDESRQPRPVNVVSDLAALEYGFHEAKDALIAELHAFKECWGDGRVQRGLDRRALVQAQRADGVVSEEDLRDMLDAHREDTGLPIVLGLPHGGSAAAAVRDPALRQWLRDALDVRTYFYGELDKNNEPALWKRWNELQAVIEKSYLEPIFQHLYGSTTDHHGDDTTMDNPNPKRNTVFISYAHKDETPWLEKVSEHLGVLEHQGLIQRWDDRQIDAGDDWRAEIDAALKNCRLALMLISPSFLNSKFVLNTEVPALLARHKADGLIIYPLLIRDCAWNLVPWVEARQVRPRGAIPIGDNTNPLSWDKPLAEMAKEIVRLMARK